MRKHFGNIVDIPGQRIFHACVEVENGRLISIQPVAGESDTYLLPGFIDAHVHIESSMLVPSEFARLAVVHGTVATVSDPHEIANVLGMEGVDFMIQNGKQVPLKFYFGAPSCVPATAFETAGAEIGVEEVKQLLERPEITYLSEMMNFPGVLAQAPEVLAKIAAAKALGKPVDGHAPGLMGAEAINYIAAGIGTDHECFSREEAAHKLANGMKILIREGSAAKNFEALIDLLEEHYEHLMFCSDDKHPDDLIKGHINQLVSRAVAKGKNLFKVLQAACWNPVDHYQMSVGRLRAGDPADFIRVKNLKSFEVMETWIDGQLVARDGSSFIESVSTDSPNQFHVSRKLPAEFNLPKEGKKARVIRALDGEIITESFWAEVEGNKNVKASSEEDILLISVVNRYQEAPPAVALIQGFGLQTGAIASCVGHDSHNIIAVGTDPESICQAVNLIIDNKGGIAAVHSKDELVLPLPIAGIMTQQDGYAVADAYSKIDAFVKGELGCRLTAPFMTLSFMALLVIPELKLSDKGLFDGAAFQFAPLFMD